MTTMITTAVPAAPVEVVSETVSIAALYGAQTKLGWEIDAEVFGEQAALLFAGQRDQREAFFRAMYEQGSWRSIELTNELTGAGAKADPEARQWAQFVRLVYAHATEQQQVEPKDLPSSNEIRLWYWLFRYQGELASANVPATLQPTKRDHAEALLTVFSDCRTPAARRDRLERMNEGMAKTKDANSPPTKAICMKWGGALVVKPQTLPVARVHWRDLGMNPPRQGRAEAALEAVQAMTGRANNLPPEIATALRKLVAVFRDDRHLLVVVNGSDEIEGVLCRQKLLWGFMEEVRGRTVGKRGARAAEPKVTAVISNGDEWQWMEPDAEQIGWANDYATLRRHAYSVIGFPPVGRKDAVAEWAIPVFPSQAAADRATEISRLQGLLPDGLRLVGVPLETVQRLVATDSPLLGRNVECVIDGIPLAEELADAEEGA